MCLLWWILGFTNIISTPKLEIKVSKQNKFTGLAYAFQEGISRMIQQPNKQTDKQNDQTINFYLEIIQNFRVSTCWMKGKRTAIIIIITKYKLLIDTIEVTL